MIGAEPGDNTEHEARKETDLPKDLHFVPVLLASKGDGEQSPTVPEASTVKTPALTPGGGLRKSERTRRRPACLQEYECAD